MFNIEKFMSSGFHNDNHNIITYMISLCDIQTDFFYKIAKEGKKEVEFLLNKDSLKVMLTFSYNKTNNNLELIKLSTRDYFYTSERLFNIDSLTIEEEKPIKDRLFELIDFNEYSKYEKLRDVLSKTIIKIVDGNRRVNISPYKYQTYEYISSGIVAGLKSLFPFHAINCIAVYNDGQTAYGRNWKIKIQNNLKDGSVIALTIPIIIQLKMNRSNDGVGIYYGLRSIQLMNSECLDKNLRDYENEVLQKRIERRNEEFAKQEEVKADLLLQKKSSIELSRERLSSIESENILKSSLSEILTSSNYELSEEQDELFENCEYVLNCMLRYISLARALSDRKGDL